MILIIKSVPHIKTVFPLSVFIFDNFCMLLNVIIVCFQMSLYCDLIKPSLTKHNPFFIALSFHILFRRSECDRYLQFIQHFIQIKVIDSEIRVLKKCSVKTSENLLSKKFIFQTLIEFVGNEYDRQILK